MAYADTTATPALLKYKLGQMDPYGLCLNKPIT
jgi:hypothetical protein